MSYTPGTWKLVAPFYIQAPRKDPRAQHDIDVARILTDPDMDVGEATDNGQLIQAAPDMAQALAALLHNPNDATVRVAAKWALARAGVK